MQVGELIDTALMTAILRQPEIHKQWISAMHRFAGRFGVGLLSISADTRTDVLPRCIEDEALERFDSRERDVTFIADMQIKLSENWILSIYEVLRTAYEQARDRAPFLSIDSGNSGTSSPWCAYRLRNTRLLGGSSETASRIVEGRRWPRAPSRAA